MGKEKTEKYKVVVILFYSVIMLVAFGSIIFRGIFRGVLKKEAEGGTSISYEKMYPFETEEISYQHEESVETAESKYRKIANKVKKTLEWYCTDGFVFQPECVEITAFCNKISGQRVIKSESIRFSLENRYIVSSADKIDTEEYAKNVIEFSSFCTQEGIPCYYVESLYKVDRNEKSPLVYDDYTNRNTDSLISQIKDEVEVLDLRERSAVFEDYNKLFFRTDTHWIPQTGLWAAKEIAEFVDSENEYGLETDKLDIVNYVDIPYPKCFLGSLGRNVGLSYSGLEDFDLIIPKFETDFRYYSEQSSIDRSGDFVEAYIDLSILENIDYYNNSCYAAYMNGRQPLAFLENNISSNELSVLFISDSFGATVAPFLSELFKTTIFIDPRLFDGSIECFIKSEKPDIVVMMYNPEVITSVNPNSNDSMYMLK